MYTNSWKGFFSLQKTVSFDDMIQPPHPVVTEEKLSLLWPQPQSMLQQETKPFVIRHHLPVYVSGGPAESKKPDFCQA